MFAFAHPQRRGVNGAWTQEVQENSHPESRMRCRTLWCGRVGYVHVSGPLDMAATVPFREQIQRLLTGGCRTVILDLSGVRFIDSEGVRALLTLRDEVEKRRARLRVVIPDGSAVDRTLRLLRFDSLFSIFRSVSAAWRRQFSRDG